MRCLRLLQGMRAARSARPGLHSLRVTAPFVIVTRRCSCCPHHPEQARPQQFENGVIKPYTKKKTIYAEIDPKSIRGMWYAKKIKLKIGVYGLSFITYRPK